MARVHHITFATPDFAAAARALSRSARRFGLPPTRIYTPEDDVVRDLAARYPDIMDEARGAGYWLWKPAIIADCLARADDGDLVLYTDAAMLFVADPAPLLALSKEHPVVLFEQGPDAPMRHWTKRDCFVALDADDPAFWDAPQLSSGFQLYRAGVTARRFVDAVNGAMLADGALTDAPNVLGKLDLPDFVAHRHDQSILTIVAYRQGAAFVPDPSQYGPGASRPAALPADGGIERPPTAHGQVFLVHRRRGRGFARWYRRWMLSRFLPIRPPGT